MTQTTIPRLVHTNDNCTGCNKCIRICGVLGACVATTVLNENRSYITVDGNRCIACGACFDACEHKARAYEDDTQRFFDDLARGEPISILIAPAFKANYPNQYEHILGALRAAGVRRMISVSFGADIATWGIVRYIEEHDFRGSISNACPVVVDYIEKYEPDLVPMLMPVQTPLMCTAIYARTQMGITDRFAFISPCIAKKMEIDDPDNHGLVSYNVTFEHLLNYLRTHGISGAPCSDEVPYELGNIWPMPGGLAEYMQWLIGDDAFIREISGKMNVIDYLQRHCDDLKNRETPCLFIDALNCGQGCLCGTATELRHERSDDALSQLIGQRQQARKKSALTALTPQQRMEALNQRFGHLDLEDYLRDYHDKSGTLKLIQPTEEALNEVFRQMQKLTKEAQTINCTACGYHSCRQMASAIYAGFNRKENCIHYLKDSVENQREKLLYMAEHDEFLDVYNRRTLIERIDTLPRGVGYSLVMINLNGFRGIADTYGEKDADNILIQISDYLKHGAEKYRGMVGRYTDDAFLVLYMGKSLNETSPEIDVLIEAVETPVTAGNNHFSMSAKIGIVNDVQSHTPSQNLEYAEMAMCFGKNTDQTTVKLYDEELKAKAEAERRINQMIQEMLDNDGFYMLYQPQVDIKTHQVVGYEALVRANGKDLSPGQFILIAETNGLIWKIGRVTTELVIRQIAEWRDAGMEIRPVSINFSTMQISDEGYLSFLKELLGRYRVPPEWIEIEITESFFAGRTSETIGLFKHFKDMGISLLMDDFGTGYSSLGYLTYLPVDVIKLDKSIVDTYLIPEKDHFVQNIIHLVHDLDKKIIIEGVENREQAERLKALGADIIQGFYYSRPLPPEAAITFRPEP
ncbi:MAG: EAL domain-containing protein [Clostridia bacterium]|nr:EAL domain-containing protein [Clostridia bacterium]